MKLFKHVLLSLSLLAGLVFAVSLPAIAATSGETACSAVGGTITNTVNPVTGATESKCSSSVDDTDVFDIIRVVTNVLSITVGVIAVIMIIVSGLKFITSGGDAAKAKSARSTLLYAIIGIVVVALAQVIVNTVLEQSSSF